MKFVALVSGGKDSFYSIMECIRNGHELLACAHLAPRKQQTLDGEEDEESYMYQTAASETIPTLVEECLGVPLMMRQCEGRSQKTSLVYDHDDVDNNKSPKDCSEEVQDEVEDLFELLVDVRRQFPEVQGISSGAILSTYQRTRIESVCARLNLTPLGYLWRSGTQRELLECMLKDGIDAVLVKVASPPGLMPQKHLNKTLAQLYYGGVFDRLKDKFDFHICGEGGEYETLVLDCPLFKKRLSLVDVNIVETDDGVGILQVNSCCAVDKDSGLEWDKQGDALYRRIRPLDQKENEVEMDTIVETRKMDITSPNIRVPRFVHLPHVKILNGGLAHVSEIMSKRVFCVSDLDIPSQEPQDHEANLAVLEAKCIFKTLELTLSTLNWTGNASYRNNDAHSASPKDVVFVHLYLSSISHFAKINEHYENFFGIVLPPSRSCVAIGENVLPGGRRVMLDCVIQRGSGAYMRIQPEENLNNLCTSLPEVNASFIKEQKMNPHHTLRSTLHVQTISHWAPVCVGPYSQANSLRSSLIFLAGQIGLIPGTMQLIEGGWSKELGQCWTNAANVLDALDGSLEDIVGGVVYICSEVFDIGKRSVCEEVCRICIDSIKCNGDVSAGRVDERKSHSGQELYGGYEDYETWKEMTGFEETIGESTKNIQDANLMAPLLMIALPQMPKGASAEVELICASSKASICLDMEEFFTLSNGSMNGTSGHRNNINQSAWDIGYDSNFSERDLEQHNVFNILSVARSIGKGCAAVVTSIAYINEGIPVIDEVMPFNLSSLFQDMIQSATDTMIEKSELDKIFILHIRLFYNISALRDWGYNASLVRSALCMAITAEFVGGNCGGTNNLPASSIVPVDEIHLLSSSPMSLSSMTSSSFGMHILAADLVHTETEMWINHNRSYKV